MINRTFDADINTMFDLWTNPAHFAQWLPPVGMTMEYLRADIRPGGSSFFCMSGNGLTMYGRGNYQKIQKPNLIVYTQSFCDKDEQPARHPLAPTWPAEMLTTVTLTEEEPNRTRVTVQWQVHGEATAVERETFHQGKPGMTQGWTGSFDKLEALLPTQA
ncbi:MAG: SRPBCC domain-containing protein [Deltaproteobacteria bacterium]|nr:SRPBCC domain-containing protein [Deltaproteobacteria bacterium]